MQPDPNGWDAARLPDGGTLYHRSHEVNLIDRWDGDQINAHLLDSIPPISVFHVCQINEIVTAFHSYIYI